MTILNLLTNVAAPGQFALAPRIVRIDCDNTLAEVKTAGFVNDSDLYESQGPIVAGDFVLVNYEGGQGIFTAAVDADTGVVTLSAQTQPSGVTVSGATISGNLAQFNNTTGEVKDSAVATTAVQLKANIRAGVLANGGGSASISIPVTGLTTASVVMVAFQTKTNNVDIATCVAATNAINVVASGDPGACNLNWIAFVAAQ